jgi:hypothetical protein
MKRLWTPACIVLHVLLYGAFFAACSYIYYLGATGEEESDLIIHFMRVADMDMASYGPTLVSPHTPVEACYIPSVEKFYNFTLEILKNIPKKQ